MPLPTPPPQNTPLDWDAVLTSELPLKVVASSLTTLRAEAFGGFTSKQDLVECLKASANVPEIVGPPRRHRGHDLVDAAVFEPIPVKAALRDGCTHVLALCSRPPDAGPAWGRVLRRAVANAVKYTVLNPVSLLASCHCQLYLISHSYCRKLCHTLQCSARQRMASVGAC
jgi:predicted patatin/cPLA2 family phospholipase